MAPRTKNTTCQIRLRTSLTRKKSNYDAFTHKDDRFVKLKGDLRVKTLSQKDVGRNMHVMPSIMLIGI